MKFTSIIATAFALASSVAALKTVKLKTFAYPPPQYPEITGQYVASWHEGAGINYMFVVPEDQAAKFVYDEDSKTLYLDPASVGNPELKYTFSISTGEPGLGDKGTLLNSIVSNKPTEVNIDDLGFITFNGSYGLKAVKNINEPYEYSQKNYALVEIDGNGPDGAVPVFLQAIDA